MEYDLKEGGQLLARFGYDHQKNLIYIDWLGEINLSSMQVVFKMYISLQEEINCPYLLNINSHLKTNWQAIIDWLEEYWVPRAAQNGLKYVAHITSPDFFIKVCALDLQQRSKGKLEFGFFNDKESAENWIRACQSAEQHMQSTTH